MLTGIGYRYKVNVTNVTTQLENFFFNDSVLNETAVKLLL